ncbi:SpoIIE family protein phosphatase [Leptospira idonii]|uniref:Stage II sporulation protein E n=1 Tax=Leptospira idonii TaxID=1193500 RepID=A0A4V3JYB5_9LEPT|nr:SpoIIE family protein phosphatase [Leptospira idonii]TGN19396.1 stage II sporulation protein E [Leptospira idonii]
MNRKSLFWELTLKLEAFTHTVPVPFAVYYAIITQKMETEKWVIFVALCLFFATAIGILGTILRYFLINHLFHQIERINIEDQSSNIEFTFQDRDFAKSVKLYIFKYPLIEGIIIVIRWFAGVIPIVTLYTYIVEYTPSVVRSGIFTIAMIPPISFVTYYFITENSLRGLFELPQIKNVEIKPSDIPKFDYFKRIVLAFFSLAALPVSVLSYLLYSIAKGETMVEEPLIPIVIVSCIFVIPLFVCSYIVAKTVKQGLTETSRSLDELAKGNFNVVVTPTSGDDFGQQAFYMSNIIQKLRGMYDEIKTLNEGLEEKVNLRTEELNRSLQEVRKLKFQQDGDYFLTYLLLSPLGIKDASSKLVSVDFLLKQKKRFEFKEKEYEIGGDINVSHIIHLQGKKYILFVNADAMGKSMQGAGGALVFGAVFQSIVQRTKNNSNFQDLTPESWLISSFQEMHRIFEAFDGTMLVSLVIGLIEEKTGLMHFLNAEHPWMVLYRDGKASYLQADASYRKLGTLGAEPILLTKEFQLLPGDVIFAGSDGKDDILLPEEGTDWEINLDENFILKIIELSKGNLKEILKSIEEKGEVIDDFSLIRLGYLEEVPQKTGISSEGKLKFRKAKKLYTKGSFSESIQVLLDLMETEPNASSKLHKDLSKLYYKIGNYSKAQEHLEVYLISYPEDDEFLYFSSKVFKKSGKFAEAIELGEKVRNRSPKKIKYLIHLFHLYLKLPDKRKAGEILSHLAILKYPKEELAILSDSLK